MHALKKLRLTLLVLAAATTLAACDDDPTRPGETPSTEVGSVIVSPPAATLEIGDTARLRATVVSTTGDTLQRPVLWTSDDEDRATVTSGGLVTAKASGPVVVSATTAGKTGRATLSVAEPPLPTIQGFQPASAAVGGPELTLTILGTGFEPDARVRWNGASRPTTWVGPGEVRAVIPPDDIVALGTVQIQVVNPGHGTATLAAAFEIVPQTDPVTVVEVRPALSITRVGAPVFLNPVLRNGAGEILSDRRVIYESSNQLVATVDGSGRVTPTGEGEAVITVRSEGVEGTTSLSVRRDELFHLLASDGVGLVSLDMRLGTAPLRFWEHGIHVRASQPSVAPDGYRVVYTIEDGASQLAIVNLLARTYVFIPGVGRADQPAWSPAGDRIAFRRTVDGRSFIFTVRPDGSDLTNLTADLPEVSSALDPAWSPDGSRIAFGVQSTPGYSGLMIMNADGTGKSSLTGGALDSQPSWNGDVIVFTRRDPWSGATDLYRVSVSGFWPFVRLTETGTAHSPAWSPDQRWIAYVEGGGPTSAGALHAIRPFGEDRRPISLPGDAPGAGGLDPVWIVHR